MRTVFGRKSVESGVSQALARQNHFLEEYFETFEVEATPQPRFGVSLSK